MSKRFIIIVLDGFGIGAMADAKAVRPGDEKANTLRSLLHDHPELKLPTLEKLGLMNAYGAESAQMKFTSARIHLWDIRKSWGRCPDNRRCTPSSKRWILSLNI